MPVSQVTARKFFSRPPLRKRPELGRASGSEGAGRHRAVRWCLEFEIILIRWSRRRADLKNRALADGACGTVVVARLSFEIHRADAHELRLARKISARKRRNFRERIIVLARIHDDSFRAESDGNRDAAIALARRFRRKAKEFRAPLIESLAGQLVGDERRKDAAIAHILGRADHVIRERQFPVL